MSDALHPLRKSFRAWLKRRRLEKEGQRYRALFQRNRLVVPCDEEIKAASRSRFPALAPKQKGSLNILAIYHSYNWEGPSLAPSLAAFGTVRTMDWKDPALSGGVLPDEPGWKERMNEGMLKTTAKWAEARPFDVVFTIFPESRQRGRLSWP